jgi:hypothetical protein
MAFRPLLPGILSSGAATGAQITMGESGGDPYYISQQFTSDLGLPSAGSASGDLSADGGSIEVLGQFSGGGQLVILNGSQSASNISIDGTSYALTFDLTLGSYDTYSFTAPAETLQIGSTYTVEVS